MKIIILGAGLAGGIAKGAFLNNNPTVYEEKEKENSALSSHHAVMRVKSVDIAKYIGCGYEEIQVRKSVFNHHTMTSSDSATVCDNNSYSYKLYKRFDNRSLQHLGVVKRYLLDYKPLSDAIYGMRVKKIVPGVIDFEDTKTGLMHSEIYDYCISTLPMGYMLKCIGIENVHEEFKSTPIIVLTAELTIPSSIHQTIYFPRHDSSLYRVTIEGRRIMAEFIHGPSDQPFAEIFKDYIWSAFGIPYCVIGEMSIKKQPNGKMIEIDDTKRRRNIMKLTDKFNIISFGRLAIWKPIRADDLIDDIDRIKKMLKTRELYDYSSRLI